MNTLCLILAIVTALDMAFTCTGVYWGYIKELNPLISWLFKLPAIIWIPLMLMIQFGPIALIYFLATDTQIVIIILYVLIIIRFAAAQTGIIATMQYYRKDKNHDKLRTHSDER